MLLIKRSFSTTLKKITKDYLRNRIKNLDLNTIEYYIAKSNFTRMTSTLIQEQIRAIEKATQNALKSKESALKFLKDAGIINTSSSVNNKAKAKK